MEIENQQIPIDNYIKQVQDHSNCQHYIFNHQKSQSLPNKFKAFILVQICKKIEQKNSEFQCQNNQYQISLKKYLAISRWRFYSQKEKIMKKQVSNIICKQKLSSYVFFYRLKNLIKEEQKQQRNEEKTLQIKKGKTLKQKEVKRQQGQICQHDQMKNKNQESKQKIRIEIVQTLQEGIIKKIKSEGIIKQIKQEGAIKQIKSVNSYQQKIIKDDKYNNELSEKIKQLVQEGQNKHKLKNSQTKIEEDKVNQIINQTALQSSRVNLFQKKQLKKEVKTLSITELRLKQNSATIYKLKKQMAFQFENINKVGFQIQKLSNKIQVKINQKQRKQKLFQITQRQRKEKIIIHQKKEKNKDNKQVIQLTS